MLRCVSVRWGWRCQGQSNSVEGSSSVYWFWCVCSFLSYFYFISIKAPQVKVKKKGDISHSQGTFYSLKIEKKFLGVTYPTPPKPCQPPVTPHLYPLSCNGIPNLSSPSQDLFFSLAIWTVGADNVKRKKGAGRGDGVANPH